MESFVMAREAVPGFMTCTDRTALPDKLTVPKSSERGRTMMLANVGGVVVGEGVGVATLAGDGPAAWTEIEEGGGSVISPFSSFPRSMPGIAGHANGVFKSISPAITGSCLLISLTLVTVC